MSEEMHAKRMYRRRTYSGRRLEPKNGILHGAGQDPAQFATYSELFPECRPVVWMGYTGIRREYEANPLDRFKRGMTESTDRFLIPQIGLGMTVDGKPERHYERDVASGLFDKGIEQLANYLEEFDRPVFIRLGYEFNGEWNGYEPGSFREAWIRVVEIMRKRSLEHVAFVWCYAPEGENKDYERFYPGNEYVDWWGLDPFCAHHFSAEDTMSFLRDAEAENFPVMFGESTPRYVGTGKGMDSWNSWFELLFNRMAEQPSVKCFCYINWDWGIYPPWSDWGDCRVEIDPVVTQRYREELANGPFLHATSKDETLHTLRVI